MDPNLTSGFKNRVLLAQEICEKCLHPEKDGIDASRILIRMDPLKEGIIELRPDIPDISLGGRLYAQVRVFIGRSQNYIKGMALYSNDIPEGYDLIFYTRLKENGTFAGYGQHKRERNQKEFIIIENEEQMLAWRKFEDSLQKKTPKRRKRKDDGARR